MSPISGKIGKQCITCRVKKPAGRLVLFNSFDELAKEIVDSRVYAVIQYTYSSVAGNKQGRKIGQNILYKLKFKKDNNHINHHGHNNHDHH